MIHIILGTKAQLIKMIPIMVRLRDRKIAYNFISTGQHHDTMNQMLADFGLKGPDFVLYDGPDIISIRKMIFWALRIIWLSITRKEQIFSRDRQGVVLVHGDTFSTLLGAVSARLAGLKVGHVESGLRSFNLFHPFPEEITRLITFRLSHILFCPGEWAVSNVRHLGAQIVDTGANTMLDTLLIAGQREMRRDHIPAGPYAVVSIHRYENIFKGTKLKELVDTLLRVADRHYLILIMHNPTRNQLEKHDQLGRLRGHRNIDLRQRYVYFDFMALLREADFVISDGGSIQEECSYLGIPCLLLRRATERREGMGKNVVLSGYDDTIINEFIDNFGSYRQEPKHLELRPSDTIIETLVGDNRLA